MFRFMLIYFLCLEIFGIESFDQNQNRVEKLRVCVVESRGTYRKTTKHCPILEKNSNFECVIGLDRLDCLRRIHKGSAHFGVFSSEDLVAARWAGVEILITNEMRFNDVPFEYEVVAIVDNEADINSAQDLRGSKFCHPGHGLENHWTDILANYFESTLVARQCEENLSLTESRIKASADFFGPSCKAGPWVPDPAQDRALKRRYPSLCQLCYDPIVCGAGDKHWGRRGPLYCLTSGYGEVAWVRLDDVKSHFGYSGLPAESDPAGFSFLCPDGHLQPLDSRTPCIWVSKPWPAIAAKRSHAAKIQQIIETLNHDNEDSWQNSLLSLLETYHVNISTLDTSIPIDDYLDQAVGFQSAYSFPTCSPPRSIVYCTTSIIQHYKCSWLQEASSVYGIEPNIQCIRTESVDRCMDDTKEHVADVILVDQDDRLKAERDYNLKPLLFEYSTQIQDRYTILAVIHSYTNINDLSDLRGKRACFPNFEGAAYLSVAQTLINHTIIQSMCEMNKFFASDSCLWSTATPSTNCNRKFVGDEGALRCLVEGYGDVAFLDSRVFHNYTEGQLTSPWTQKTKPKTLKLLCPYGRSAKPNELCYLHWTPRGHLMINNQTEIVRKNEIYNSLRDMDKLFGKQYRSHTIPFTMFGPFDKKNNVMFRDTTDSLRGLTELEKDKSHRLLEKTYTNYIKTICRNGGGNLCHSSHSHSLIMISLIYFIVKQFR